MRDLVEHGREPAGQNYEHARSTATAGGSIIGMRASAARGSSRGPRRTEQPIAGPVERGLRQVPDGEHMRTVQWTVLIVEDDLAVLGMLGELFEDEGYRVQSAVNGADGLACIARGGLDLVLLDLSLPDCSGVELCRQVRSRERQRHLRGLDPQLPIVMLSAWEDPERQQDALAAGANAYVTKPFDVDALLARVQACLNGG